MPQRQHPIAGRLAGGLRRGTPLRPRGLLLAALVLLAPGLAADVIHYKDGRKLEGVIVARDDVAVEVETSFGTLTVEWSKIARIEEKPTPRQELQRRRAEIADADSGALYQLALWAAENDLRKEHRALLEEVLAADPAHAGAHEALGHVLVEGTWMQPEEVEGYLAKVEEERRAAGLMFHEGEWLPEDDVMRRRGLVQFGDEWLPLREGEARRNVAELQSLVGLDAQRTAGEHVTVYWVAPPEPEPEPERPEHKRAPWKRPLDADVVDDVVFNLDALVRHFVTTLQLQDHEVERVLGRDVPIYLLPDLSAATRFVESGYVDRYRVPADTRPRFLGKASFGTQWPDAMLVLVEGPQIGKAGDPTAARLGFLCHQLAALLVERLDEERLAPGWARVGLTAYYEGATNYYGSLSLSTDGEAEVDAEGELAVDLWVPGWESFPAWRDNLRDPATVASVGSLEPLTWRRWSAFDSQQAGLAWSFVRFLLERHPTEFADYLRRYDGSPGKQRRDAHRDAWASAFAEPFEDVEAEWRSWCLAQPERFPPDELGR